MRRRTRIDGDDSDSDDRETFEVVDGKLRGKFPTFDVPYTLSRLHRLLKQNNVPIKANPLAKIIRERNAEKLLEAPSSLASSSVQSIQMRQRKMLRRGKRKSPGKAHWSKDLNGASATTTPRPALHLPSVGDEQLLDPKRETLEKNAEMVGELMKKRESRLDGFFLPLIDRKLRSKTSLK